LTSEPTRAKDAPIVCVVSNPRSGSTALRYAIATGGQLKDFGEIFHDDRRLTALPFLDFLERWPRPLAAMLNWTECEEISRAYVRQLNFESYGQRPLIDIKHNAWSVLRPLWQFPHGEPLFMTALKEERCLFVQLKRENLADQVISYIIANHSQIWHARIATDDIPEQLRGKPLDPVLFRRLCRLFLRAEALSEDLLSDYKQRLTLVYEEIFADGVLTSDAAQRLTGTLGADIRPATLPLKPNTIAKRAIIANYDEVLDIAASIQRDRKSLRAVW
jgi:hypothetical protein